MPWPGSPGPGQEPMAEHDGAETATGPPTAAGPRPPGPQPWQRRAAVLAGSTTALVLAGLAGSALGFLNKAACRSGDWNIYLKQFQAHCYTDIYPLYYNEGLSAGRVPYTGHPVEYPVLIGAAMQAVAWLVRPISDAAIRGREFFDVTVVLLTLFALAGTVAIIAPTGWERFYQLSATRTADWGSIWYFFETEHWPFVGTLRIDTLNVLALAVFVVACLFVALIILAAPRRPRLPQVFFLTLA